MYFTDHPLYLDSPATILVVGGIGMMLVLPPCSIISCVILDRCRFLAFFIQGTRQQNELHINATKVPDSAVTKRCSKSDKPL